MYMDVQIDWIDAQQLEPESKDADAEGHEQAWALLRSAHGVLVPGVLQCVIETLRCVCGAQLGM